MDESKVGEHRVEPVTKRGLEAYGSAGEREEERKKKVREAVGWAEMQKKREKYKGGSNVTHGENEECEPGS